VRHVGGGVEKSEKKDADEEKVGVIREDCGVIWRKSGIGRKRM